jgi:hypothetical protein
MPFLTQNKGKLCKILIITLVFEKNANFFTENWQKSQKIVIITSTPDWTNFRRFEWLDNYRSGTKFGATFFHGTSYVTIFTKKVWASFRATFSQSHLVTLLPMYVSLWNCNSKVSSTLGLDTYSQLGLNLPKS